MLIFVDSPPPPPSFVFLWRPSLLHTHKIQSHPIDCFELRFSRFDGQPNKDDTHTKVKAMWWLNRLVRHFFPFVRHWPMRNETRMKELVIITKDCSSPSRQLKTKEKRKKSIVSFRALPVILSDLKHSRQRGFPCFLFSSFRVRFSYSLLDMMSKRTHYLIGKFFECWLSLIYQLWSYNSCQIYPPLLVDFLLFERDENS